MAIEVVAQTRTGQGRGASRRLRHSGKVPGVLYGGKKPAVNIELEHNPLYHQMRNEKFHASVLTLALDGAKESVLRRTRRSTSRCRCTSSTRRNRPRSRSRAA